MFLSHSHAKKRRIWPWVILVVVVFFGAAGLVALEVYKDIIPEKIVQSGIIQKYVGEEYGSVVELMPHLLGFSEPQTYIILFQNNTEMRPSGGFIGAYTTVHLDRGVLTTLVVEGSEELDRRTPREWKPEPPKPLTDYLGVPKWYFRDANWSPDFAVSAKKARELYVAEGGVAAADVDGVIAITPTVIEAMLGLTGPVTVQGITFTKENVTETLEYEVEYGYKDRGIPFETRKQILDPFMHDLMRKVKYHAFLDNAAFTKTMKELADQKQILASFDAPDVQKKIDESGWGGKILPASGDYLAWVDANMAALKTDHAVDRSLSYTLKKNEHGKFIATATMTYAHGGIFDWRTSRYRTYTRIYVPEGSTLISTSGSMKKDKTTEPGIVDTGTELGKTWFGTFISIEPKQTKTLSFTYQLPDRLNIHETKKDYSLLIQKQPGTKAHGLTVDLNFGTSITSASPAEHKNAWGDERYSYTTDLRTDRAFDMGVK